MFWVISGWGATHGELLEEHREFQVVYVDFTPSQTLEAS